MTRPKTRNIENAIARERIRQARNTSNLALIATAIVTSISLISTCILLFKEVSRVQCYCYQWKSGFQSLLHSSC